MLLHDANAHWQQSVHDVLLLSHSDIGCDMNSGLLSLHDHCMPSVSGLGVRYTALHSMLMCMSSIPKHNQVRH